MIGISWHMDTPPGLGFSSPLDEKIKSKNPRRRAKKAAQRAQAKEKDTEGIDEPVFAASAAQGSGPEYKHGTASSRASEPLTPKLDPATEKLLAQLRGQANAEQLLSKSQAKQEPPAKRTSLERGRKPRQRRQSTASQLVVSLNDVAATEATADGFEPSADDSTPAWGQLPGQATAELAAPNHPTSQKANGVTDQTLGVRSKGRTRQQERRHSAGTGGGTGGAPVPGTSTGFQPHWDDAQLQNALRKGRVLKCEFRVNAADRRQGFAGIEGLPADVQIQGLENQNRAIFGDQVAVQILPQAEWVSQRVNALKAAKKTSNEGAAHDSKREALEEMLRAHTEIPPQTDVDALLKKVTSPETAKKILSDKLRERPDLRATGRVVAILEPSPRRDRIVGVLQQQESRGCVLIPVDPRMPRGRVQLHKLPANLRAAVQVPDANPADQVLVSAMIYSWPEAALTPDVLVRESLGQAGEIEIETKAILEMEGVDTEDFGPDVLECLPTTPWQISPEEIAKRRDLRTLRLFSIDPPTARDLDDALSVEELGGGTWRVGVHIADVSHFVPPGSALDAKAALRATSVYLVQRVIPMLPQLLCEELCSLNPGVDRLAFSVMWEMDEEGHISSQWTGRTVIRSCAKLAYPHAQAMIDGAFAAREGEDPPVALETPHTWPQVVDDVLALNRIARNLNRQRFENGALRLNNVKLAYRLDADGNPASCEIYEQQESNELVAEFMLLANMSVAQLIGTAFSDKAMLRRHPMPEERKMGELEAAAQKLGYDIDCSSAATIHESLKALRCSGEDPIILNILQLLATKPMKQAQYFSTGTYSEIGDWRHYALAVPMYTHFTSPIRRYPDVIVHRLLARLLAEDPAVCTRVFSPAPLGTLEQDKAEGKLRRQQQAVVAVLEEVAMQGEELKPGTIPSTRELLSDLDASDMEPPTPIAIPVQHAPAYGLPGKDCSPWSTAFSNYLKVAVDSHERPSSAATMAAEEMAGTASSSGHAAGLADNEQAASQNCLNTAEGPSTIDPTGGSSSIHLGKPESLSQQKLDPEEISNLEGPTTVSSKEEVSSAEGVQASHADEPESSDGSQTAGLRLAASSSDEAVAGPSTRSADDLREPAAVQRAPGEWPQEEEEGYPSARPVPRSLAKKVADSRRINPGREKGQAGWPKPGSTRSKQLPVSKGLLENEDVETVARHCNERKTAAKTCSDASSRLYLCVMLRKQPMVLEALVTILNGSRFFDLYVPLLGIEARIHLHEVLPAVEARWDAQLRHLRLSENTKDGRQPTATSSGPPCLMGLHNSDKLHNPRNLQPLSLPLEVTAFTKLPVVVCARSPGNAKPLASFALLYLRAGGGGNLLVKGAEITEVHSAQPVDTGELE